MSWSSFDSPADALAADTVAIGTEGPLLSAGTTELFGVDVNVYSVPVADVLKGADVRAGEVLQVASTPATCTGGGVYPDGDPLGASGTLILFLYQDPDTLDWRTLTPFQGVVAASEDGKLPLAWPKP